MHAQTSLRLASVVYEMATGKKAFEGKSQASLIANDPGDGPPPMSSLQPMTPPALDRVVKRCLAKEPEKRWQSASDLCEELKWIAEGGSQVTSAADCRSERRPCARAAGADPQLRRVAVRCGDRGLAIWNLKPSPSLPAVSPAR